MSEDQRSEADEDEDEEIEGELVDEDENKRSDPDEGQVERYQDQEQDQDGDDKSQRAPTKQEIEAWWSHQQEMGRTDTSSTLAPLQNASAEDWLGSNKDPDVMLSIPNLGVDHIGLTVDNLRAHVELHAKVLDLLELHVGADASIERVDLEIDNVRVQAMLKVKLENVVKIVDRVMQTIDNNPEILTNLTAGLGKGLESGLGKEHATELEGQEGRLKGVEKEDPEKGNGRSPSSSSKSRKKEKKDDNDDDDAGDDGGGDDDDDDLQKMPDMELSE